MVQVWNPPAAILGALARAVSRRGVSIASHGMTRESVSIFAIIARALVIEFCWRRCRWLWWLQGPYAAEQSTWWREHGELGREHGELCSSAVAAARAATLVAR